VKNEKKAALFSVRTHKKKKRRRVVLAEIGGNELQMYILYTQHTHIHTHTHTHAHSNSPATAELKQGAQSTKLNHSASSQELLRGEA
jgi:hypothetical protein